MSAPREAPPGQRKMSATMVSVKDSLRSGTSVWTSCSSMYSRHIPLHASETTLSETHWMLCTMCVRTMLSTIFLALRESAAGSNLRRGCMFS